MRFLSLLAEILFVELGGVCLARQKSSRVQLHHAKRPNTDLNVSCGGTMASEISSAWPDSDQRTSSN